MEQPPCWVLGWVGALEIGLAPSGWVQEGTAIAAIRGVRVSRCASEGARLLLEVSENREKHVQKLQTQCVL